METTWPPLSEAVVPRGRRESEMEGDSKIEGGRK